MTNTTEIIYEQPKRSFSETLEEKARDFLSQRSERLWDTTIEAIPLRDLASTLHRIDSQNALRKNLQDSIRQEWFYVYVELERAELDARYRDYRKNRVEAIKNKLSNLDREKRNIELTHLQKMEVLITELANRWNEVSLM